MIAAPLRIVIFKMISIVLQTLHVLNDDHSTNICFSKMPLKLRIMKFQFYISWSINLFFYPRVLSYCCLFYICVLFSRPYLILLYWEDNFVMLCYVFIYTSVIIQFLPSQLFTRKLKSVEPQHFFLLLRFLLTFFIRFVKVNMANNIDMNGFDRQ